MNWRAFYALRGDQRGMTLIELMIVVIIIAVLAAIAVPAFVKYIGEATASEARSMLGEIKAKEEAYFAEFGVYVEADWNPSNKPGMGELPWETTDDTWLQLGVRASNAVKYQYMVVAGGPNDAVKGCDTWVARDLSAGGKPWYAVCAKGDIDEDERYSRFLITSTSNAVEEVDADE